MNLLTTNNTKILKGTGRGYMTCILHLAPADSSGNEVCPKRTLGCTAACLNYAGRGQMKKVQTGRLRKTRLYFEDRELFMSQLIVDIKAGIRKAEREDATPCFRLNGTSDIPWERVRVKNQNVFEMFPGIQFYDYTKIPNRKVAQYSNYHLTFSKADGNDRDVAKAIAAGMNVAVVFGGEFPKTYLGLPVINADEDDLRFLDPKNVILALKPKGRRARRDTTGFVVEENG
jgi:hypothetical protein